MNTDNNGYFSAKDILPLLKQQIDYLENQIAEKCGMKLYKSSNGFTQEEIYEYAGAKDCVATLTLSNGSSEPESMEISLKDDVLHTKQGTKELTYTRAKG